MYRKIVKPFIDIVVSIVVSILISPFFLLIVLLLLVANRGKVFFFQERPGQNERLFTLVKFRTMSERKDKEGALLPDKERLTTVGKLLRMFSLDEIPQLFNVMTGRMSFVGPRPLLTQYLALYNNFQKKRHLAKPGITGWAQVNGRNAISWQEKFNLDVWYVDHISFWLDLKILGLTMLKVIKSEGITAKDSATMENFTGNQV